MDVIPYAGAVRRGIVRSQNPDLWLAPYRGIQHEWDQMRLRIMVFSQASLSIGARSIEVP